MARTVAFRCGAEEERNREEALRLLRFETHEAQASDLAGELSYGQHKLLTLACYLATGAKILLLDEPVAGVPPEMVTPILELLCQLGTTGKLVVFIEHDLIAVRQIADRALQRIRPAQRIRGRRNAIDGSRYLLSSPTFPCRPAGPFATLPSV